VKTKDVIRAWKDAGYRQNLSAAERANLPAHPAGMIELTDANLGVVSGGGISTGHLCQTTAGGPNCPTGIANTLRCCHLSNMLDRA